jgi:prepilin-type N-terminal cleavage/methylation domain-containing protein/prepilin-type processing-associated H-X9-DG protein
MPNEFFDKVRTKSGFSLVELLTVIAIMGILTSLLLPAIQSAREAARRTQCLNNLHQLGIAALSYESAKQELPPGVEQTRFAVAPIYRGTSLFVSLLPYLEHESIREAWNSDDPVENTRGGAAALAATVVPGLLCPSDILETFHVQHAQAVYALTSYGGNGGTRSYFPSDATIDGLFHTTGQASEPESGQRPVRMREILDGTGHTLLFGERSHDDPNLESFAKLGWTQSFKTWGWWAPAGGRKSIGHVTMSAATGINFGISFSPGDAGQADPPVSDGVSFAVHGDLRVCALGSRHPGGANFALADGGCKFLVESIPLVVLRSLATRSGSESISSL